MFSLSMNAADRLYLGSFQDTTCFFYYNALSLYGKGLEIQGKIMKKHIFVTLWLLMNTVCVWGVQLDKGSFSGKPEDHSPAATAREVFRQNIPEAARQFIGTPYEYGGNPLRSGTSDNSYLFFAIYTTAAQRASLTYHGYLPMANLLQNVRPIDESQVQKGDLVVLDNQLAAMVFDIESSGRLHFIYVSEKRRQVISFHSDNLVFDAYWLKHMTGFFRLKQTMLK
jgi:hypothetical protein